MKLILWTLPNSGLQTMSHLSAMLSQFGASHKDITVKTSVLINKTLWQRLFSCKRKDPDFELPDLVEIPHYWTALFSKMDFLENLSKLDKNLSVADCIEPLKPHCFLPGSKKIHSVPWWMSVTALHYRVDHLKKITKDPENFLKTWDGMLKACSKLKKIFRSPDYFPIANSSLKGSLNLREVLPFIWENGGDLFNADLTQATVDREQSIKAIKDFLVLFKKGFMPLMRERGSLGTMMEGKASMVLTRRQSQAVSDKNAQTHIPLKTLPAPGKYESSVSFMTSYNLAILKSSNKKKHALKLLKWLTRVDSSVEYSKSIQAFPCSTKGFEQFIFSSHERMKTYAEIVAKARCLPSTPVCATYVGLLDEVLSRVCRDIVKGRYKSDLLPKEMARVKAEVDYLISLYGD
ncbi:MAG TPA: extracellular solute-binding protein [Elusimicrobiales bacterium]|nr:extracellular solute-binding protein [Elusimicrobiales bacterium]